MKKFLTTFFTTFFTLFIVAISAHAASGTIVTYTIDPEKNAFEHNNKGIVYVEEKCYYAAIQEFKIAISLNPKTQATAVYFNNLGKVYLTIGYPQYALDCFKNAIKQYSLNFEYYQNLAKCYKLMGKVNEQIKIYQKTQDENPLNKVMLGLLTKEAGNIKKAIIILDEFTMSEPDLLITPAVKNYIQELVTDLQKNYY